MLRGLTTPINRRQGIAALLAMAGLAVPAAAGAKKKKGKKGKKLGDTCQNNGQCSKANAICAANDCASANVCCLNIGKACRYRCDCCTYSDTGIVLYCRNNICSRF